MTATNIRVQMQIRRDSAANWNNQNPVLKQGEWGYETDTGKIKIGDGSSQWTPTLPYAFLPISGGILTDNLILNDKKEVRFYQKGTAQSGAHYTGFRSITSSGDFTYNLPGSPPSSDGHVLSCTAAGQMSWTSDSTEDSSKMPLTGGVFSGDVTFDGATAGRDIIYDRSADNLIFNDDVKAIFGTGSDGLEISHTGNNSFVKDSGSGSLFIQGSAVVIDKADGTTMFNAASDGTVKLYSSGTEKISTSSTGVSITGFVNAHNTSSTNLGILKSSGANGDGVELRFMKDRLDGGGSSVTSQVNDQMSYIQFYANNNADPVESVMLAAYTSAASSLVDGSESGYQQFFNRNGGTLQLVLQIAADGVFSGSASADISDQRLKENIQDIANPLDLVKAIRGRSFTWKQEAKMPSGLKYGFIAQELETVLPDVIIENTGIRSFNKDGDLVNLQPNSDMSDLTFAKSISTISLIPIINEALKICITRIEKLESDLEKLKG